jgi:hypothetical protein
MRTTTAIRMRMPMRTATITLIRTPIIRWDRAR